MNRAIIVTAILSLAAAVAAGPLIAGDPLAPGSSHRNTSTEPVFVLLSLAPDAEFANNTDETFCVLTVGQFRELADAMADPRVIAHEDAIDRLSTRLAKLESDLSDIDASRKSLPGGTP